MGHRHCAQASPRGRGEQLPPDALQLLQVVEVGLPLHVRGEPLCEPRRVVVRVHQLVDQFHESRGGLDG